MATIAETTNPAQGNMMMTITTTSLGVIEYTDLILSPPKVMKKLSTVRHHHDGSLYYSPKIYANLEINLFNGFQDNTVGSVRVRKLKQKNDKSSSVVKGLCQFGSKMKSNLSLGVIGAEKLLVGVDSIERWKAYFGSLNYKYITSISCYLFIESSNSKVYGEAFFANGLFGFFGVDTITKEYQQLRVFIPYVDVVSITKAQKTTMVEKPRNIKRTHILPLSNAISKPSVIQLWTTALQVHQFFGFGPFFDDIFKLLISSWKSLNPVH